MNNRIVFVSQQGALPDDVGATQDESVFAAATFAYKFLYRRFWQMVRALLLPILAAGAVLYICLSAYISELLLFVGSPAPRFASIALGNLAAGIFVSLFCFSVGVSATVDAVLGRPKKSPWALVKTERQDWRIYAAYLRLMLVLSAGLFLVFLAGVYVAPQLGISPLLVPWLFTLLGATGAYWLIARIGFLIAPVIAAGEGPVLRAAWTQSSRHVLRNGLLIALLAAPGCLIWFAGELLLRLQPGAAYASPGPELVHYANAMAQTLGMFVALAGAAAFFNIVLLTAGALYLYRGKAGGAG